MSIVALASLFVTCVAFNRTLHVRTFNLPTGITCPGASAWCRSFCYARHGMFKASPDVPTAHDRNWRLTADIPGFVDAAVAAISKWRRGSMLRIHSCGDFYSLDYLRAWMEIAVACPHVRFAAYTRCWRLGVEWREALAEAEDIPNLCIWWSTDPTTGDDPRDTYGAPRCSYILDPSSGRYSARMPVPNCQKQSGHSGGCKACGMCWDKHSYRGITFQMH